MSAYKNYVQDFPRRCQDILKMASSKARFMDREVTLSLMVASAAFVIPFERLNNHPFDDKNRYPEAAEELKKLLKKPFLEFLNLSIENESSNPSWHYGKLPDLKGGPDTWGRNCENSPIKESEKTNNVIRIIRNALAHGNIYTFHNPIKSIIFIQRNPDEDNYKNTKDYSFVLVTPESFLKFLESWFKFINNLDLDLDYNQICEILNDAA